MASDVYFIDFRATVKENFIQKLERLLQEAGISRIVKDRDLTAVKIHFGERGNTAFIRPVYIGKVVECIKTAGGVPFLTDANTLYAGARGDSVHHLETAFRNGFAYSVVEAPVIIADGLRGKSESVVPVEGHRLSEVYIGTDIVEADALISVAHFKGHELSGFGGTLKNVGMGCASRKGKMVQHTSVAPEIKEEQCIACGECADHCSQDAIAVNEAYAEIDTERCIGCGECILICQEEAVQIQWNQSIPVLMESMVEYSLGVLKNKADKALFINFIADVSPGCDCMAMNDAPIVRNIGVLASLDPVAIDQASVDRVNQEPALPDSCLEVNTGPGEDKFRGLYPEVDWSIQLEYAEKMRLGSRDYTLRRI